MPVWPSVRGAVVKAESGKPAKRGRSEAASHAPHGSIVAGFWAPDVRNRGSHAAPGGRQDGGAPRIGGRAVTRSQRGTLPRSEATGLDAGGRRPKLSVGRCPDHHNTLGSAPGSNRSRLRIRQQPRAGGRCEREPSAAAGRAAGSSGRRRLPHSGAVRKRADDAVGPAQFLRCRAEPCALYRTADRAPAPGASGRHFAMGRDLSDGPRWVFRFGTQHAAGAGAGRLPRGRRVRLVARDRVPAGRGHEQRRPELDDGGTQCNATPVRTISDFWAGATS